jgi:Carboxypeptidase regulatory-like domain
MVSLIKRVKLSKKNPVTGESIRVEVQLIEPTADVTINGVYGANQFLQFRTPGTFTVVVTAALGKQIEQVGERVKVSIRNPDLAKPPIILATQNRYQPRMIEFSIANEESELLNVQEYVWNFGDGASGVSEGGMIGHDYTEVLARDSLYTAFDVQVDARYTNGFVSTGKKTISVFNTYALNKLRYGILTPRVTVQNPLIIPTFFFLPGKVICQFTVTNLEDDEISFTGERYEWLVADPVENPAKATDEIALTTIAATLSSSDIHVAAQVAPSFKTMDLRVPARSTITVERVFSQDMFTGNVFGVAIHMSGVGMCSKLPAISSAYIEVKLPMQWSGLVSDPKSLRVLQYFARATSFQKDVISHQDMREHFVWFDVANVVSAKAATVSNSPTALVHNQGISLQKSVGYSVYLSPQHVLDPASPNFASVLASLLDPTLLPFDEPVPVVGKECDPDNLPDDLPDGMVCQLTAEFAWRYVPGRVLNAKKGDCLLDPGGPGLVGQLLRQVTPAQFYSHCGIMTKNHIELRHSTGSDDWLKDHPAGSFLGNKGTDGFDTAALKYLWPGTVTQTIDNAYYGEWITSPDTGPYRIADFSFAPDLSDSSTIIYPLVVKPNPFDETAAVRRKLHGIADAALAIQGHYRFYCYTKPEIALGPEGIAGKDSGWAKGTIATTCSSFIWLAAQHANVKLESPNKLTAVGDLEQKDVIGGAGVDGATLDGLYFYTAAERQAAANWLFQDVYDIAHNKAGFWGTLFTDAPDTVANQLCNTFASDSADINAVDEDAWKTTGTANSVSPDNIMFWDSPGSGNQEQFRSVYGHVEEVFYRPGTYAQVPIYRWNLVPTKGTLKGTVTANADVSGANVSLLGSNLQDVVVGSNGRFEFDNVPSGDYQVTAGLNIGGYWNSATVSVHIDAGKTTDVLIALQPPPEIFRLVTIWVEKTTDWSSALAHHPSYFAEPKTAQVQPFHSHAHLDFDGPPNYTPRAHIGFDIDLNADLSITVSWSASEFDDETEGGSVNGGRNVAKNAGLSWHGLVVANDDPIDNDATTINFTITNDQANH